MNLRFQTFAIAFVSLFAAVNSPATAQIEFGKQIRPILSRHCLACHGPDDEQRQADLRLDSFDSATESAILPGNPDESDLIARISSADDGDRMPPPEHGKRLSKTEIELLRAWVKSGAEYTNHWSFVKPQKLVAPNSRYDEWSYNEIDRFIAVRLEGMELEPSSLAEPHRLIRRLALDLTGLPPRPEQVDTYVANPTDETYGKIVDQMLASPAYGEHWAAMWLDIARYADTIGYAEDRERTIWPWRDWVTMAFNNNMRYDQFTIEQIAGDLLPQATESQKLATAFHRNTLNNTEGGTNDEEFRTIAVKDRISTTVNVWMGLTIRCAECHTHKYDPISQTEYYQFLDFFNQTEDSDQNDESPRLDVFPPGRETEFAKLEQQIEALKAKQVGNPPIWDVLTPTKQLSRDGTEFDVLADQSVLAVGTIPDFDEYALSFRLPKQRITGLRLEVIPDESNGGKVGRSGEGAFVISQMRATTGGGETIVEHKFSDAAADHSQANYGIELAIRDTTDETGWAVNHPQYGYRERREAILTFATPLEFETETELTFQILQQSPTPKSLVGRVRLSSTKIDNPAEKYRKQELDPLAAEIGKLETEKNSPVRVPVMAELPTARKRETHVMIRGSYLQPGEIVSAAVMKSFHPLPADAATNRLGIAQWLVSPDNPLTARVTVNRFWARIFGIGIVETEEDFGTQGAMPTHPELLDWLAVDFQENGWDVKRLLKQMVMSATYRQSKKVTPDRMAKDARNQYYSRGPRVRLSAEVVRDQALAVSGLLSNRMYGAPVFPPNPVKKVVNAFTGGMNWNVSEGENRYRRAIYTFLKRSSPHPLFDTFDMATREVCSLRRLRTNTPLQSFMTLNDETFIECAQSLAVKMRNGSEQVENQIKLGLETALVRPAIDDEVSALQQLYLETFERYQADVPAAREMSGCDDNAKPEEAAQLAALTVVANVILNLDSFLTK